MISFSIKENEEKGTGLISAMLPHKNGIFQVSTGIIIPIDKWDSKIGRLKVYDKYWDVNNKLDNICTYFGRLYKNKDIVSENILKMSWGEYVNGKKYRFSNFVSDIINSREVKNSHYKNCLGRIIAYNDIEVININKDWFIGFCDYLVAQNYSDNYIFKMIGAVKGFIKSAYDKELIDNIRFLNANVYLGRNSFDRIYLNTHDIETLYRVNLNGRLDYVRSLFVLGLLTGLRYSELLKLDKKDIYMDEGKKFLNVAINNKEIRINFDDFKYDLLETVSGAKTMSPQKFNDYLKDIAKIAGFDSDVIINEFRGGKEEAKTYKKWQLFNLELARRSFFVNSYMMGIPLHQIMDISGHSSLSSFFNYIKVNANQDIARIVGK